MTNETPDIQKALADLRAKVNDLNTRAKTLTGSRENLIKQAATLEQTRNQATAELKELGIEPADFNPETLVALQASLTAELNTALGSLEAMVVHAEALTASIPDIQ